MADLDNPTEKDILIEKMDALLTKVSRLEFAILFVIILMFILFTLTLLLSK